MDSLEGTKGPQDTAEQDPERWACLLCLASFSFRGGLTRHNHGKCGPKMPSVPTPSTIPNQNDAVTPWELLAGKMVILVASLLTLYLRTAILPSTPNVLI